MREIVFDTETTGLDNSLDRVIEIGGVELWNHIPTGKTFHVFVNPDGKKVDPAAFDVHGISNEFLTDKPRFAEIVDDFVAFFADAKLIAHNAFFDVGFLNAELKRVGQPPIEPSVVIDTLSMARRKFPMAPATLDALCSRFSIDTSRREKHGALLDSELLADVYIELIGGRQSSLGLVSAADALESEGGGQGAISVGPRKVPLAPRLSDAEKERHRAFIASLGDEALWWRYLPREVAEDEVPALAANG
ncbi:DNA polymerase-3 subunit epsilon [Fulvimarina manganoxydans]|uniref:DNA polymerase III subunit epsilon n=1 Tax=Fulvimarina manganoxydans TaxID=937218 RepID=A0A1W2CTI1_9HYPH|nr:DNA polymerase III subunit epsilon [Fulvimarina manganoxydans]MEE2950819.1 DNA polymerase III subunit epsilon [Pseudomonadota bacterium]SMC88523.1 DNA polymerase-3 subunit epsilon [Fulvimarina manganoxydans]